jgi:two-component system chemotaxis response regulator CheY
MRILIVEDDPISRRVLEANLIEWGYDVMTVSDGEAAMEILGQPESPSLVISDWMMPRMDGLTLCRTIRGMATTDYIYFIILTARGEKKDIIEGLEAGADDFLTKPFNQEELKYRTRIGERILNLERRIKELANTDPLTGMLNRRAFMERMAQEMSRARREAKPLSLVLTDIDHFKRVNDTYGHQAGDRVLLRLARAVSDAVRTEDVVARYGGEEFVVILRNIDVAGAVILAERLRQLVEQLEVEHEGRRLRVTASFGCACLDCCVERTGQTLIATADMRLFEAKRAGRNRVVAT